MLTRIARPTPLPADIIHPFFIVLVAYSYVHIVTAALGDGHIINYNSFTALPSWLLPYIPLKASDLAGYNVVAVDTQSKAEAIMWGACVYITLLTELVTWPIAWLLCKAPILNRVL